MSRDTSGVRVGMGIPTGLDHEAAIPAAAEYGFDFVEVMMHGPMGPAGLPERADRIRELLDDAGLDLTVHLPMPIDLGSPMEPVRAGNVAAIEDAIEAAADAGAEKGVLHPTSSAGASSWDGEAIRRRILESVDALDGFASDRGFEVCAENLFNSEFNITNFDQLLEAIDVSMTLDTGHGRITGASDEEIAAFAADHGDRISHVHLNDNRIDRGYSSDEHVPFGFGTLDFETILAPLLDGGWSGTMAFEIAGWNLAYYRASKEQFDAIR